MEDEVLPRCLVILDKMLRDANEENDNRAENDEQFQSIDVWTPGNMKNGNSSIYRDLARLLTGKFF